RGTLDTARGSLRTRGGSPTAVDCAAYNLQSRTRSQAVTAVGCGRRLWSGPISSAPASRCRQASIGRLQSNADPAARAIAGSHNLAVQQQMFDLESTTACEVDRG